ncbi:cdkn1a interacting zinc finger protein 1a [Gouania willdenowi]|nr:cip1-interacting zinc finger protein-like [Gouania willdenowi]
MFNPHIHHHQHQQQQQFQQHLRQLQQLFQQQPPPPPPPQPPPGHHVGHHHQTQRSIPAQAAPPPRMMNLCQATQTTIIAPNPMLQGALLMQQMQGNMRSFGMGGQQFRQFYAAGTRSSLLGPVPMGMTIKPPMRGYPSPRPYHPPNRYYNNNISSTPAAPTTSTVASTAPSSAPSTSSSTDATTRPTDQKRDSDEMTVGTTDDQQTVTGSTNEATNKASPVDGLKQISEELPDEPVAKKQRTEEANGSKEQSVVETITIPDEDEEMTGVECNSNVEHIQSEACIDLQEEGSATDGTREEIRADEVQTLLALDKDEPLPAEEALLETDAPLASLENQDEEEEEGVGDGSNKFYCYLCSITCQNQQNFRNHMNSISHQQRMMEIQHMSNACLVSILPRVHESLQGANRDGEKKSDLKHWCATCQTNFNSSIAHHRRTMEHKLASRTDVSSCAVCKKHFKTSLTFLEHLQSQEHRQKLQEKGSEAFSNLAALDTEGFSLEEEERREEEEDKERPSNEGEGQDGWSSLKEVTLNDMTSDEQYDPDTVYGSSFLVPAAGFICELCNKFCHFETSVLHSHCKSQTHFDNFKRYVASKVEAGEPVTEDLTEGQRQEEDEPAEPSLSSKDVGILSLESTCNVEKNLSTPQPEEMDSPQTVENQETPEEVHAGAEDAPNEDEDEEVMEVASAAGKKKTTGKAKSTRRSGRATNRR